jgi:hypothetical protein
LFGFVLIALQDYSAKCLFLKLLVEAEHSVGEIPAINPSAERWICIEDGNASYKATLKVKAGTFL